MLAALDSTKYFLLFSSCENKVLLFYSFSTTYWIGVLQHSADIVKQQRFIQTSQANYNLLTTIHFFALNLLTF